MSVRGVRGATTLSVDTKEAMSDSVVELLKAMLRENNISTSDIISILFTATPDIHSTFPATAARELDLGNVPLICAQEMDIDGGLPLTIRVLLHVNSRSEQAEIKHQFLRGARVLRPDLPQK